MRKFLGGAALGAGLLAASSGLPADADGSGGYGGNGIRRVLLISIDGMHALDFINCAQGISGVNGGNPYCPNLADLADAGVNYLEAAASQPSDSFPGLMALVAGGSPRTVGAFYDVAYDRVLAAPAKTTGNGVAAGQCMPKTPNGTRTEYEEGIDKDQSKLDGGANDGSGGGITSIDKDRLIRDPFNGCKPVYPWNFVRTNTIFGIVHQAGGYTAWSDKHPSYSSVAGPGDGTNVDDYYSPEINSNVVPLPGVPGCTSVPDPTNTGSWTDSFDNIKCYDTLKVQAILNEINGRDHTGAVKRPVPTLFGMNFQVVSVGQKLIEKSIVKKGGYLDNEGRPSDELLGEIQFADTSIGKMVVALKSRGLYQWTLIVISAKHGQSPIDSKRYLGIGVPSGSPITTSPAGILDALLPPSEQPFPPGNPMGDPPQIGPTEDDISLLWLSDSSQTTNAVQTLGSTSPATNNIAGIGEIFSGPGIAQMFDLPGLSPKGDPRTPDIIVQPNIGVTYSGSTKKLAEHGGFAHDDLNVIMLVSNASMSPSTVTSPVETRQVAPTILSALGLDPNNLTAVQQEGTQILPGLGLDGGKSPY